jgi:hypothetical protein
VTALEIIQAAAGELGIPVPANAAGSTDLQVSQLLALLNASGRALAKRYDWQALTAEATFNTVADEDQGAIETIIGADEAYRHILNDVIWNRDRNQPVYGPRSPQQWQAMKASGITGPTAEYRIRGGHLIFLPVPAAGEACAFEYITRNWAVNEAGDTPKSTITQDDDEPVLDAELLILDLKWRWQKAKGLSYAEDFNEAEAAIVDAMARDGTNTAVSMDAPRTRGPGLGVPEGSWPLS